jgi:integrase
MLPPAERHRRVSVSLGKLVKRLGRIAFPRFARALTPYAFRHALAAEMKASGVFTEAEIAAALGHLSARTQQHYGSATSSRGLGAERARQITAIRAADPVRAARQRWRPEGPAAGAEGA